MPHILGWMNASWTQPEKASPKLKELDYEKEIAEQFWHEWVEDDESGMYLTGEWTSEEKKEHLRRTFGEEAASEMDVAKMSEYFVDDLFDFTRKHVPQWNSDAVSAVRVSILSLTLQLVH